MKSLVATVALTALCVSGTLLSLQVEAVESDCSFFSLYFDGFDDYVFIGETMLVSGEELTVACWYYHPDYDMGEHAGAIVNTGNQNSYSLQLEPDHRIKASIRPNNQQVDIYTGDPLEVDRWYHLAMTYDGSSLKFYVDGIMESEAAASGTISTPQSDYLCFGGYLVDSIPWSDGFVQGLIDEVSIWSIGLTQVEIVDVMECGIGGGETGLAGYWKIEFGSGSVAYDSSTNGINGEINGALWCEMAPVSRESKSLGKLKALYR